VQIFFPAVYAQAIFISDILSDQVQHWGYRAAQLVYALRYKLAGGGFDSRWGR
jgi:hypothetical protein